MLHSVKYISGEITAQSILHRLFRELRNFFRILGALCALALPFERTALIGFVTIRL